MSTYSRPLSLPPLPPRPRRLAPLALGALGALGVLALPAAAQFTRVNEIPPSDVFCVDVEQDVIAAGLDTAVYVSTDGGTLWRRSAPLSPAVAAILAVKLHEGRLYAGTFGQGVFVSDDLGASWSAFNQGLTGGILNTQLDVSSLEAIGDNLLAGTLGAGVYVRNLRGSGRWTHFGEVLEPEQASNVNTIALGGGRLLAAGGTNGSVFWRKPGDADWTPSGLGANGESVPGVQAQSLLWTGKTWVAGTSSGLFLSATGQEPWILSSLGVVSLRWTALAMRGPTLFAAFDVATGVVIGSSADDGLTWRLLERLPGVLVYALAGHGDDELFAARGDGLWRTRSRARPATEPK